MLRFIGGTMKLLALLIAVILIFANEKSFATEEDFPSFGAEDIESSGRAGRVFREMYAEYSERAAQIKELKERFPNNEVINDVFDSFKSFDRSFKSAAGKRKPGKQLRQAIQARFALLDYSMKLLMATANETCPNQTTNTNSLRRRETVQRDTRDRTTVNSSRNTPSNFMPVNLDSELTTSTSGVR